MEPTTIGGFCRGFIIVQRLSATTKPVLLAAVCTQIMTDSLNEQQQKKKSNGGRNKSERERERMKNRSIRLFVLVVLFVVVVFFFSFKSSSSGVDEKAFEKTAI
jgi:Na+/H+ antiporter NhaD/arsenite permease-like protein